MKYINILLLSLFLFSCKCPDCFTPPEPFRLSLYNSTNDNLLDPTYSKKLEISSFEYKNGKKVNFVIKDYIIKGYSEGIYHLEVRSKIGDSFYSDCIQKETTFFLKFKNQDVDTLNIFFEEIEESKCCSYFIPHLKYNNIEILKGDSTIGAFIVIK